MGLILNLDTATEWASVCLSKDGHCLLEKTNDQQKEHAAFINVAIQQVADGTGISLDRLDAVACTIGPGSYTGLRVGLATAKGLCYALQKPLIGINTLLVIAAATRAHLEHNGLAGDGLICPMIDARRMEVFTGLYSLDLNEVLAPCSMVLNEHSFEQWNNAGVICCGSGSEKFRPLAPSNFQFIAHQHSAAHLGELAEAFLHRKEFLDVAYAAPLYLKEFYSTQR